MDPLHFIVPPKARPSGSANDIDIHQTEPFVQKIWFIIAIIILVVLIVIGSLYYIFCHRKTKHFTKDVEGLNGI